jgi:spore germination protein YaaH
MGLGQRRIRFASMGDRLMKKIFALLACTVACGFTSVGGNQVQTDTSSIPARHGTVISDGCTLDPWQMEILESNSAKLVIHDIVLDCLLPHADGTVTPADGSAKLQLSDLVAQLHGMGYGVSLAASFVTDNGYVFDGTQTAKELTDPTWIANVATNMAANVNDAGADAVDLDLELLPATARPNVTQLVAAVAARVRPAKLLNVFLPPSIATPSDVIGGDAFDVPSLAIHVDRFRVMTLDYSGNHAGPTIDSGWAVDAYRFAQNQASTSTFDVSFPLYGNDFTTTGTGGERLTTYLEALGLADTFHATAQRGSTQELFLDYTDDGKNAHEVWYDDAQSTLVTLAAWDTKTIPANVGVTFYGFGAEDPALWDAIAEATQ